MVQSFERREGSMGGFSNLRHEIPVNDFYNELSQQGITLGDKEKSQLSSFYGVGDTYTGQRIQYKRFHGDLTTCMAGKADQASTQALTREQKETYKNILRKLEARQQLEPFVGAIRKVDVNVVHMVKFDIIKRELNARELATTNAEWTAVRGPLKASLRDECDYRSFLEHLLDGDKMRIKDLLSKPIADLVKEAKSPGATPRTDQFTLPRYTKDAKSAGLDSIGRRFISRGGNYEQWLTSELRKLKPDTDAEKPKLTMAQFKRICKDANIDFDVNEENALRTYYDGNEDGKQQVKLTSLLRAVGLPPQTVGAVAHKQAGPKVRMLSKTELRSCYDILKKIKRQFEKNDIGVEKMLIDHLQT
jgi:hypothetical protein